MPVLSRRKRLSTGAHRSPALLRRRSCGSGAARGRGRLRGRDSSSTCANPALPHGLAADLAQPLCAHLRRRLELFAGCTARADGVGRGAGTGRPGSAARAAPPSHASGSADAGAGMDHAGAVAQRSGSPEDRRRRPPGPLADGPGGCERETGDAGPGAAVELSGAAARLPRAEGWRRCCRGCSWMRSGPFRCAWPRARLLYLGFEDGRTRCWHWRWSG